ncbi:MAG: glycosyltransferase [Bacteroidetes bacterium]|nr:glycosyltransferase [Bacteroidota bacterium]
MRKELSIKPEEKIIGNFSALADHKDYPTFLEVARLLLEAGHPFHFVIAGDGAEEHMIKSFISKHQLQSSGHLDALKNAVLRIFADPELRNTLVNNARQKVNTFSFQATAEKTRKVYEEVLRS